MTAQSATSKSESFAGRAAPTPFSDLLATIIEATARENRRATGPTSTSTSGAGDSVANRWRRSRRLILCVAGLVVAAPVGWITFASKGSERQSPTLAADSVHERKSPVVGNANTTGDAVARPLPSGELDGSGEAGVEEKRTDEGIGTGGVLAARSNDLTVSTPVAGQPTEQLRSDAEPQLGEDGAEVQPPAEVLPSDPIAPVREVASEQPVPLEAPSSSPAANGTGSPIDRASDPVAIRTAQATSAVKMRAGPSNSQAVVAIIPAGSSVEVVNCRQWCEVVFAGQRGWVYKTFIGPSPTPRRP